MTPAEELDHAYRSCLDPRDPNARRVLVDLAEVCHVARTTMPDPADPLLLARNEGKRAVYLYLAGRLGLPLILES